MNEDEAKLAVTKHALKRLSQEPIKFASHRDLFHPGDWGDQKKVADVAARKSWQRSILQTLVELKILEPTVTDERGEGFRVIDSEAARNLNADDNALYWLLAPKEFDPPGWVRARLPRGESADSNPVVAEAIAAPKAGPSQQEMLETFIEMLKTVSDQLTAVQSSYRRVEDKINKFDFKANEAREKTLQLVASAVSDVRQCAMDLRSNVEEIAKLSLDIVSREEQFLHEVDDRICNLSTTLKIDRSQLVGALDLHKRYSDISARISEITGALAPLRSTMQAVTSAAQALDVGVDTAMELAREIEEKGHGAH